jgi:hypothetical protein
MAVDKRLIDLIMGNVGNETNPFGNALKSVEPPSPSMGSIFGSLAPPNALSEIVSRPPVDLGLFGLGRTLPASPWTLPAERPVFVPAPTPRPEPVKRKVYFAFDFDDLMRVNNVRQIGKIGPAREMRNARSFFDRSIWESRKITNPESLKNLMRNGVKHSSAVCALIGSYTWRMGEVRDCPRGSRSKGPVRGPPERTQPPSSQGTRSAWLQSPSRHGHLQGLGRQVLPV